MTTEINNNTLRMALRNVCVHCGEETLRWVTDTSVDCVNPNCAAWYVTLEVSAFITLTPEKLATYAESRRSLEALDTDQDMFDAKVEAIMQRAAEMKAARARGEQVYG